MITNECCRCGGPTDRAYQARFTCLYCIAFFELQDAYAKLQEQAMTDEDILALDDVRATCHGGGAAVAITIKGEGQLNLDGVQEMLREGSKKLVAVTDHYGGWDRIARLRGIK